MSDIVFACPACTAPLDDFTCTHCRREYSLEGGIHRFMPPGRLAELSEFLDQYRLVREREGYQVLSTEQYRALPLVEHSPIQADLWRVRRESFEHMTGLLGRGRLRILDLGAGNGWLSNQLSSLGHECVAVDWLDDMNDGLGAYHHYEHSYRCVQADFNALPFAPAQFDVVIFNASLHYAPYPDATLMHASSMLADGGQLFVMDSPTFRSEYAGHKMLVRQEQHLQGLTGRSNIVRPGVGFLTRQLMKEWGRATGFRFKFHPSLGRVYWAVRRVLSGIRHRREPAAFGVWHGIPYKTKRSSFFAGLKRRLVHGWLTIQNRLLGLPRPGAVIEHIDGISLVVLPEVFNPVLFRTGEFLVRAIKAVPFLCPEGHQTATVLDLGCGAGAGSIFAAQRGARVIASDLNPQAVRCTKVNTIMNQVEDRVETRLGDLFEPVMNERFDVILFNPPFYLGDPKDPLDMAWRSERIFERFASGLKDHLTPTGRAMIVLSTDGDGDTLLVQLKRNGFVVTPFLRRDLGNEVITVYSATPCHSS